MEWAWVDLLNSIALIAFGVLLILIATNGTPQRTDDI